MLCLIDFLELRNFQNVLQLTMSEVTATGMHNDVFRECARGGILYPQCTLYRKDMCNIQRRQTLYFVQVHGFPKTSRIGQVDMEAYAFII